MKKNLPIFAVLFLFSLQLQARKIEGIIIYEKDTLNVVFNIPVRLIFNDPDFEKLQQGVVYFDARGKRQTLRAYRAREFRFRFGDEEVRMVAVNRPQLPGYRIMPGEEQMFLKLRIDGPLRLFQYYRPAEEPDRTDKYAEVMPPAFSVDFNYYYLQKKGREIKYPEGFSFKNDMSDYFRDCPGLSQLLESKELRKGDLETIVNYYNTNCGN
ncbi:MAG: hypothetical protein H6562_24965 [Lewinellaceae bacterium]|nr:hypothetical protein [Lewinella sp.]MCB9282165.1 hypothetical protein [Lewinellaceae bacterium]